MNTQVTSQISLALKSLLTHITNVSFLWLCASVFVHVIHKAVFLCETLPTVSTSKLFSSVRPFMYLQGVFSFHPPITIYALVWLLSSVNEHVTLQEMFGVKSFLADTTDVSSHTQVFVLNMLF